MDDGDIARGTGSGLGRPTVLVVGDGALGDFLAWEWHGEEHSTRCVPIDPSVVADFRDATPDSEPRDCPREVCLGNAPERLRRDGGSLAWRLHHAVTGPLCDRRREEQLMQRLGRALLPRELVADILVRSGSRRPLVRLMPSRATAAIPWGLLGIPDGRRLIDIADVVMMAPLVGGSARPEVLPSDPAPRCLHVIDPDNGEGAVLDPEVLAAWRERPHGPDCRLGTHVDRIDLSVALRRRPARLFYVGHVAGSEDATRLGLLLSDGPEVYGLEPSGAAWRPFTSLDLFRGTIGIDPRVCPSQVPPGARDPDGVREVPGKELWPMPPRVTLVACSSGVDLTAPEPFGLATAMLAAGAVFVTATLWTLPTDETLMLYGQARGFSWLARELELLQQADRPVAALNQWQRHHLASWRRGAPEARSPLLWGGIVCYAADAGSQAYQRPPDAEVDDAP